MPPVTDTGPNQTIVARPRACDAVGFALRDAFTREQALPEELTALLRKLNGNGGMRQG